jgi:hypothetical protein
MFPLKETGEEQLSRLNRTVQFMCYAVSEAREKARRVILWRLHAIASKNE